VLNIVIVFLDSVGSTKEDKSRIEMSHQNEPSETHKDQQWKKRDVNNPLNGALQTQHCPSTPFYIQQSVFMSSDVWQVAVDL
jgi:hypothetical protein